jgi:hypothetical protein
MAATIGATPTSIELRLVYLDEAGEPAPVTIPLGATSADADIETLIEDLAPLTNAFLSAKLVKSYDVTEITNTGKPAVAVQSLVAAILAVEFQRANPLNANKTIRKQVILPAYINAIRNDGVTPHVPVTSNADLNAVVAYLEDHLDYVDVAGDHYEGGWTYNPSSKFGTRPTVTDGY